MGGGGIYLSELGTCDVHVDFSLDDQGDAVPGTVCSIQTSVTGTWEANASQVLRFMFRSRLYIGIWKIAHNI